jgi:hypothetical protein
MLSKKRLILAAAGIFLLGCTFHYLYDLLGHSVLAAPFFAVNESIWEHMKLLSTAVLIWMAVDYFLSDKSMRPCFFAVRAVALPIALVFIPLVFYFLKGAFDLESVFVDIALFFAACILYQSIAMHLEVKCAVLLKHPWAGILALSIVFLIFVVFTFIPPHLPLFKDMPTGLYGIIK